MSTGLALTLIAAAVLLPLVIAAQVWFFMMTRRRSVQQDQLLRLSNQWFTGQREVAVQLTMWKVSPDEIRSLAHRRGYVEIAQPNPALAAFRYAPAEASQVPGRTQLSTARRGDRDRVATELAQKAIVWTELADIGATTAEVAAVAGRYGASIARTSGDRLNPTLLLSKVPITSLADTLRYVRRPRLTSFQLRWATMGLMIGAFAVAFVLLGTARQWALPTLLIIALSALPIALLGSAIAVAVIPARGSTTERMTRLINEFTSGKNRVAILPQQYHLDPLVFGDVAAEFGYGLVSTQHSFLTSSRWNRSWMLFAKRTDPRDATGLVDPQVRQR